MRRYTSTNTDNFLHRFKIFFPGCALVALAMGGCISPDKPDQAVGRRTASITKLASVSAFNRLKTKAQDLESIGFCAVFSTSADKMFFYNGKMFSTHAKFLSAHVPQFEGMSTATINLLMRIPDPRELRCGQIFRLNQPVGSRQWAYMIHASDAVSLDDIQVIGALIHASTYIAKPELIFLTADQATFNQVYRPLLGRAIVSEVFAKATQREISDDFSVQPLSKSIDQLKNSSASPFDLLEDRVISSNDTSTTSEMRPAFGALAVDLFQTEALLKGRNQEWNEPLIAIPYAASVQHLRQPVSFESCRKAYASCALYFGPKCQRPSDQCIAGAQADPPWSIQAVLDQAKSITESNDSARFFVESLIALSQIDSSWLSKVRAKIATTFGSIEDLLIIPTLAIPASQRSNMLTASPTFSCNQTHSANCISSPKLEVQLRQLNSVRFASQSQSLDLQLAVERVNRSSELASAIASVYGSEIAKAGQPAVSLILKPVVSQITATGQALFRPTIDGGYELVTASVPGLNVGDQKNDPANVSDQVWLATDAHGKPTSTRRISYSNQIYPRSTILSDKHLKNLAHRLIGHYQAQLADSDAAYPRRLWARYLADQYGDVVIFAVTTL